MSGRSSCIGQNELSYWKWLCFFVSLSSRMKSSYHFLSSFHSVICLSLVTMCWRFIRSPS